MQTVSVLANLRLVWPESVEAVASFADLDFANLNVGILRPDCLFTDLESEVCLSLEQCRRPT